LITEDFRAALAAAGAEVVSYIPNNAFLVRASAAGASALRADGGVQAVLPYEPVYKLKGELLSLGWEQKPVPEGLALQVLAFADARAEVTAELGRRGLVLVGEEASPFGVVLTVQPRADWVELALLPGVELLELGYPRIPANDLSRERLGVASDSQVATNYLNLTGSNVLVAVNDSLVDRLHPDLTNRVFGPAASLVAPDGHGTHVAAIIAGSGAVSATVTNARGSVNPGTNGQYRGVAPGARLFAQDLQASDRSLQEGAAGTNALISNNSWSYGVNAYNLAAASYDAAVRDAVAGRTGSQPVLFVFAAGNSGRGADSGLGGTPGSVFSPGTAKNVITVGALEQPRDITNGVAQCVPCSGNTNCATNAVWEAGTSSELQVAGYSGRGNVGIGIEGDFGRFKPDVVAPGTFVVSARSTTWDEAAYYNPTSHQVITYEGQLARTNALSYYSLFVPCNAVGFSIQLYGNDQSPVPFPDLLVYVRRDDYPSVVPPVFDFVRTNSVSVPPDAALGAVGQSWYFAVRNTNAENVSFNLRTDVVVTNDLGNYFEVLSNLNNSIAGTNATEHYYRYESGTSMAAGQAAGTLALLQEFFEHRLTPHVTNSPALLKALLINGARAAGPLYDFEVRNAINYQGWGVIQLPTSLHAALTNYTPANTASSSMLLVDQAPTNALASGQSQTRYFTVNEGGRTLPLRATLVWTDPPGSPMAGVKLVNDLDLVITNYDDPGSPVVYRGNEFPPGSLYTYAYDAEFSPDFDAVNNVENIYLPAGLGSNYSVTVVGHRVNVNAVTAHTNDVVQDYALVLSCGNGEVPDALRLDPVARPIVALGSNGLNLTLVTNWFDNTASGLDFKFKAATLTNQWAGANPALLGVTNGMSNQWHFYIVTNTTHYTNAAFLVSGAVDAGVPRAGVFETRPANATRAHADADLYVSGSAQLLVLNPAVIAAADQSRTRNTANGDEDVVYTNSSNGQVYYVGVKSEDQMAAQYEFYAVFSEKPLGDEDENGFVQAIPLMPPDASIPDGSPDMPGVSKWLALLRRGGEVRRVVVTNSVLHERFADVVGAMLTPGGKTVVLNNHWPVSDPSLIYNRLYEDNDEGDFAGAIHPDGPGKLRDSVGDGRSGQWKFTYVDNGLTQTGRVQNLKLKVERQPSNGESITNTVAPHAWQYYAVNVPVGATNLEICLQIITASSPGPLQVFVRKEAFPTPTAYDYTMTVTPPTPPAPGQCFNITPSDLPPLSPGRYYIGIYNPNASSQTYVYRATWKLGPGVTPILWNGTGQLPLLDDAVTNYSQVVTNRARIAQVEVGLRVDHPRVSDLAFTLISPKGTRVLLMENRGNTNTAGIGTSLYVTNFVPVSADGGPQPQTNIVATGATVGTLTIDYNFRTAPDQMTVYYDGAPTPLLDTGMINGVGRLTVNYGPGASTEVVIIMNEFGNAQTSTLWDYTVSSISDLSSYLVFCERTNAPPIKFATPPFTGPAGTTVTISDFEPPTTVGNFVAPTAVDGWSVLTNQVSVLSDAANAQDRSNYLALANATLTRTLPTVVGEGYALTYWYRGPGAVGWWRGELSGVDEIYGNNGSLQNVSFPAGEVGQAFGFGSGHVLVADQPVFMLTNSLAVEGWIYPNAAGGGGILWRGDCRGGLDPYFLQMEGDSRLGFYIEDGLGGPAASAVSLSPLAPSRWWHVAGTFDGVTGTLRVYTNGVLAGQSTTTQRPFGALTGFGPTITIGNVDAACWDGLPFNGRIDEISLYSREISASEIKAIYRAGTAGKFDAAAPAPENLAKAAVVFGGATNVFFGNNTTWQSKTVFFTATTNQTPIQFTGLQPGVLVDTFTLSEAGSHRYVLPEESLDVLKGENAFGTWRLEIWDSRTGQTSQVALVDWQLQFVFQTNTAAARPLNPCTPFTTTIPPGQIFYYTVDVPFVARFATNLLWGATGPVGLYFNQHVPPGFSATNSGDIVFTNGTDCTRITAEDGFSYPAPTLVPGQRYYLAIENKGGNNATFTLQVCFDLSNLPPSTPLTNGVESCTTNLNPLGIDYYRFTVSTNARRAQFEINHPSGDMTLLLRKDLPPTFGVFDYFSANPSTNEELVTVFDFTAPVPLSPGDWYVGAANLADHPVTYCIRATEWLEYGTNLVITNVFLGTNSFCLTWTSLPGVKYFVEGLTDLSSTNWVAVSPTITAAGYATTYCVPLPSPFHFFRVREGVALNVYIAPPVITEIRRVLTGYLISWGGPTNAQYQVQWANSLNTPPPVVWTAFTNPPAVTSQTGLFQYLDDGSETGGLGPMRFYRLLQLP
jgi:subtilisin-like proprotein convertase family protein